MEKDEDEDDEDGWGAEIDYGCDLASVEESIAALDAEKEKK